MYALQLFTWLAIGLFIAMVHALWLELHSGVGLLALTSGLAALVGGGLTHAAGGATATLAGAQAASMISAAVTAIAALMLQEMITTRTWRHH